MTDDELMKELDNLYTHRVSLISGGFLAMAGFFSLANVWAKFYSSIFIPFFPALGIILLFERRNRDYRFDEIYKPISVTILIPVVFWLVFRPWCRIHRYNPLAGDKKVRVKTVADKVMEKQTTTSLSQKELEHIKKRNEKFRAKKE